MKKFIYLCGMMLLSLNMMAQINGDANWNSLPVFIDNFNTVGRSWNDQFVDQPQQKWHSYYYSSGVTHGNAEHQVFQRDQCTFDPNIGQLKLASDYISPTPMTCSDFDIPNVYWLDCDDNYLENNRIWLYYYSGGIETNRSFRYGYFEIRCKLPIHRGAFPAFWLFRAGNPNEPYYEEIDIFEFSWSIYDQPQSTHLHNVHPTRLFTNASIFSNQNSWIGGTCGKKNHEVPANTSLDSWNTFGCEWSPNRIVYYFNGDVVNEYYNSDSVPFRPMTLIANYALDNYCVTPVNGGQDPSIPHSEYFPDTMYIDYIKVNQLKCNCDDDIVLYDNQDIVDYIYSVKRTISFLPSNNITISSSPKKVFRATDEIIINSGFELQQGQEFELIIHPCPDYGISEEVKEQYKKQKIHTR